MLEATNSFSNNTLEHNRMKIPYYKHCKRSQIHTNDKMFQENNTNPAVVSTAKRVTSRRPSLVDNQIRFTPLNKDISIKLGQKNMQTNLIMEARITQQTC